MHFKGVPLFLFIFQKNEIERTPRHHHVWDATEYTSIVLENHCRPPRHALRRRQHLAILGPVAGRGDLGLNAGVVGGDLVGQAKGQYGWVWAFLYAREIGKKRLEKGDARG